MCSWRYRNRRKRFVDHPLGPTPGAHPGGSRAVQRPGGGVFRQLRGADCDRRLLSPLSPVRHFLWGHVATPSLLDVPGVPTRPHQKAVSAVLVKNRVSAAVISRSRWQRLLSGGFTGLPDVFSRSDTRLEAFASHDPAAALCGLISATRPEQPAQVLHAHSFKARPALYPAASGR